MSKKRKLAVAAGIIASFIGLSAIIITLAIENTITGVVAGLMLVALFGMYVGFGILIAVYRLIAKLE